MSRSPADPGGPPTDGPLGFGPDPGEDSSPAPAAWPPPPTPPPTTAPPARPPGAAGRPGVLVGIAAVVLLAVVGVSALRAGGSPSRARLAAGDAAPPFAAPLALSGLDNDANVATPATVGEEAGAVPACEVRRPDVLNACALWQARPLAVAFFSERSDPCVAEVDRLDAAAGRHPEVAVAAVAIRGDPERLGDLIRARGWRLPVAIDRDGIVADLYGVVVCPQIAFVGRGGRVTATSAGASTPAALDRRLAALSR